MVYISLFAGCGWIERKMPSGMRLFLSSLPSTQRIVVWWWLTETKQPEQNNETQRQKTKLNAIQAGNGVPAS